MKTIAQLDPDSAADLVQWLKKDEVPCETKVIPGEGGLEDCEILVSETDFDRACDVAEKWDAARLAEKVKKSTRKCDNCGSKNLEPVPHETLETVLRCKDCDTLMPVT
ncbi:MAG: hypothetical protein JWO95_1638 [Verrucomicrobiales bacterium]|nr:hypothetical protein [Verrucomicrobiales bacterium]